MDAPVTDYFVAKGCITPHPPQSASAEKEATEPSTVAQAKRRSVSSRLVLLVETIPPFISHASRKNRFKRPLPPPTDLETQRENPLCVRLILIKIIIND